MLVVVDTGVVLAMINSGDQYHRMARDLYGALLIKGIEFSMPRIALIEIIGHITRTNAKGRDATTRKALRVGLLDRVLRFEWPILEHDTEDYAKAESWWRKYADHPIEYPDLLIAATCERMRTNHLWTFDNDLARFAADKIPNVKLVREPWKT